MQEPTPDTESSENPENSEERLVAPETPLGDSMISLCAGKVLKTILDKKKLRKIGSIYRSSKKTGHALDHVY
ncbi:MAG: hypothetical protein CM1200mP28_03240 [Deltaproteobacteria bacterium]|nr:MAG: hypothetical protein CM1200mP28_03240 [Deltaproteobacteria bacterium]